MSKQKKTTNDLSQLGNFFGVPTTPKKANAFDSKDYYDKFTNHKLADSFRIGGCVGPVYDKELIEAMNHRDFRIDNFNLKLNKFARHETDDKGYVANKKETYKFRFHQISRSKDRNQQEDLTFEIRENYGFSPKDFEAISRRHIRNAKVFCNHIDSSIVVSPDWRLVIGLGGASIYETSMTLHHIYGIPYIPASSIKGIVHHWATDNGIEKSLIKIVFGEDETPEEINQRGNVIFFDAFPTTPPKIEMDIMNPHYPKWYSEGKPPTDTQDPIPIPFLTIGKDSKFQFVIGLKRSNDKALLTKVSEW
jgi:CRISPR-associated protein Cmr6